MSRWLSIGLIGGVLLFLAAPLLIVAGVSVNASKSLIFPPQGFSLQWYGELFTRQEWLIPLKNSVAIALVAAAIAPVDWVTHCLFALAQQTPILSIAILLGANTRCFTTDCSCN
jgi:putative spermidine/putrescine transport system permease protein